jgi:ubiquinone biosynthesis protein
VRCPQARLVDGGVNSESIRLFPLLGYGLLIVTVVLVLRVLVVVFRE